ncbi:MAG: hypothetical protein FH751_03290 [Firmicutes bacterium]|nr:hypothetical protein [Bacillota bacterium]
MGKIIKLLTISFLLISLVMNLFGCTINTSTDSNNSNMSTTLKETSSEGGNNDKEKSKDDILEIVKEIIKSKYQSINYDNIEVLERHDKNLYMIKTKKKTFADGYLLYNSKSNELFVMPVGWNYVSSYKVFDENHVAFNMKGEYSESNYHDVPYIYDCKKMIIKDGKSEFLPIKKNMYFPLEKEIDFGGKSGHSLTDIIVTLEGIQVAFGPQNPKDAGFFADYTIPPFTKTSYKKDDNQLIIEFKDTLIDKEFAKKGLIIDKTNAYIKSVELKRKDSSIVMIISLKKYSNDYDNPKYYTANIGGTLTVPASVEFDFHNQIPNDY